jgi:AcrR family transcriptional regulator
MTSHIDGAGGTVAPPVARGLRARKRERTVREIRNAALDLFIEKGFEATTVDEIAERAEISRATFFRHFPGKADVVFGAAGDGRVELRDAILGRPAGEPDLVAATRALRTTWLPTLDPRSVARQTRAAATSPLQRGLSFDLAGELQAVLTDALAVRRRLKRPDDSCRMAAALAFAAFSRAVNDWVHVRRERGSLSDEVDRAFATLEASCRALCRADASGGEPEG